MEQVVHAVRSAMSLQPIIITSWNDDRLFQGCTGQARGRPQHYLSGVTSLCDHANWTPVAISTSGFLANAIARSLANGCGTCNVDITLRNAQRSRPIPLRCEATSR